jgi:altronate hydrolase
VFGSKPTPTIKLGSNTALARQMPEDIDFDCGIMLTAETSLDEMGGAIFERLIEVAGGRKTASEEAGLGDHEFVPWVPGAMY